MKKHNVPFPNAYKDNGSSLDSNGKGKALMANSNSSKEWILDLVPPITWVLQRRIFLH